jgi:hypothetical protein
MDSKPFHFDDEMPAAKEIASLYEQCDEDNGPPEKLTSVKALNYLLPNNEDKICPECAEAVKKDAKICRYCRYRFDRQEALTSLAPTIISSASRGSKQQGLVIWGVISTIFMVIGSFGPWISALIASKSGMDGDGWFVLLLAIGAAISLLRASTNRGAGIPALTGGLLASILTLYDGYKINATIDQGGVIVQGIAHIGWGLNVAIISSLSLAICGDFLRRADKTQPIHSFRTSLWGRLLLILGIAVGVVALMVIFVAFRSPSN